MMSNMVGYKSFGSVGGQRNKMFSSVLPDNCAVKTFRQQTSTMGSSVEPSTMPTSPAAQREKPMSNPRVD